MKPYKTYMWQEAYGDPVFRIQTNDPAIHKRMRQRKDFTLVLWGLNTRLWVYKAQFYSRKEAIKSFKRITRSTIKKTDDMCGFYAQTGVVVAHKERLEV